jgi:hypothetical protein
VRPWTKSLVRGEKYGTPFPVELIAIVPAEKASLVPMPIGATPSPISLQVSPILPPLLPPPIPPPILILPPPTESPTTTQQQQTKKKYKGVVLDSGNVVTDVPSRMALYSASSLAKRKQEHQIVRAIKPYYSDNETHLLHILVASLLLLPPATHKSLPQTSKPFLLLPGIYFCWK